MKKTKPVKEKKIVKKESRVEVIESLAKELVALMGTRAEVVVEEDKENEAVRVNLTSPEETGLLIGKHGETIAAMQTMLGMMAKKKLGEWVRIIVDIGDWREKQESHLKDLANQAVLRVKETGQPQNLYNLTAGQRRVIHLFLTDHPEVVTESQGEGRERYLVVRPK